MLATIAKNILTNANERILPIVVPAAQVHLPGWYPKPLDMRVVTDRKYTYRLDINNGGVSHDYDVRLEKRDIVVRGKVLNKESGVRKFYNFVRRHRLPDDVLLQTVQTKTDPRGFVTVSAKMKRKMN